MNKRKTFWTVWLYLSLILLIGPTLIVTGCGIEPEYTINDNNSNEDIEIVLIDGCEYIKNPSGDFYYVYTHKGDCCNPIHVYKSN